ncbi:leucyl aminopeptidase [Umboniibacter marinipuniceus]|uniref:Probable cytosol aminopeptidase n=1 Tax=Umboniibacter marinipuniceus TaxID=569599 RepID=A0A3M0A4I1_9GAMM|nr:leucyl aminopeptidase [Umboniibacter marinipuniceus]RMA79943.1 aminopeptidase A [Umboniibacter marinipuniceus]
MQFTAKSCDVTTQTTELAVLALRPKQDLQGQSEALNAAANGAIARVLESGDFNAKAGETLLLPLVEGPARRILLVGCGADDNLASLQKCLTAMASAMLKANASDATLYLNELLGDEYLSERAEAVSSAIVHSAYRFDDYKSEPAPVSALEEVTLHCDGDNDLLDAALNEGAIIASGVNVARTLGNLPGNVAHPVFLAERAVELAQVHEKLNTKVLGMDEMEALGMGAFISVAKGSTIPGQLIVMEYNNGPEDSAPIALVGKGITFDTGGISLKPGAGMDEMKFDMCGAASVFGTIEAVLDMELPINLVCIVAAAENMPAGNASKPGDIVTTMSGQTVEILNTDAEGRLVLCDALTYTIENFKPAAVVDIATLTGACVIALGHHASGMYSNNEDLADDLLSAGEQTGDRAWRMPLWDIYQQQLNSNFADMGNIGGKEAGSVTAACFLSRFVGDTPWAHLDIAGSAWVSGAQKGATGRPVKLLVEWLRNASV